MTQQALANIEQIEASLWSAADQLRANANLPSSEYCMPVLGVIFLRHAANRYEMALAQIKADQAAGNMPKALQDIREIVEAKLAQMLANNPQRMDYYRKYQEIVADYNLDKDRVTIEETFARLLDLAASLDAEQRRAVEEGLTEEELALFDLLNKKPMGKAERERVKQASKGLLDALQRQLADVQDWTGKEQTQAEVEVFVLDHLYQQLPSPPFTDEEKQALAEEAYRHVWQQGAGGAAGNLNS